MFALVDANSFYASVERVFRPDLEGRAVVVLSNNDGCIVARSDGAKALGIKMAVPYFEVRDLIERNDVAVFSSNYTLYDDMSRRAQEVLRPFADRMEVYSIDESFLFWRHECPWQQIGEQILSRMQRWTGLPVGVGFGPTKTLAKLGNHLAKRAIGATGVHVIDTYAQATDALSKVEMTDLWGIAHRMLKRLAKLNIKTPLELRDANPHYVRKSLGVVMEKMIYELRGESCIPLECETPDKQNICCSRSFGQVTNDPAMLREAVATFASQAAVKLRRQDLVAGRLCVFVNTDIHAAVEQYGASWAVRFPPTADTRELAGYATHCLHRLFRPQHFYKKAGVYLMELGKRRTAQPELFEDRALAKAHRLMKVMDNINRDHGRGTVRIASSSPMALNAGRTWHLRSDYRSPRYTTRWDELPVAIARKSKAASAHSSL